MIQKNSLLRPSDSCGVFRVRVFHLYRGFKRRASFSGDFVKVSAIWVRPENPIKKKSKHRAIIVRTRYRNLKLDGSYIVFKRNRLVLLKKRLTPKGRTLRGPASRNVRRKKFLSSFSGTI